MTTALQKALRALPRLKSHIRSAVRMAHLPLPRSPRADPLRNDLARLRDQLNAIAADKSASPRERQRDIESALASHRKTLEGIAKEAETAHRNLEALVRQAHGRVQAFERDIPPIAARRIERRADYLMTLSNAEALADFKKCLDGKNAEGLLAHSLLPGETNDNVRRALCVLVAPADWAAVATEGADIVATNVAARLALQGFAELEVDEDPAETTEFDAVSLIELGNSGLRGFCDPAASLASDLPRYLADIITPGPRATAPAAEPDAPAADDTDDAPGAA